MEKKCFLTFIICLPFLFSACAEKQKKEKTGTLSSCDVIAKKVNINGHEVVVCDLSLVKDTFDIPISSLISDFEMVRLENTEEALATNNYTFLSKNHIGHYNSFQGQYKLYDRKGKFLANLGGRGQGPNEYFSIYSSYIDEGQEKVYLLSGMGNKIFVFDFEGNPQTHIISAYPLHKGQFWIDQEKEEVTIMTLPFKEDVKAVIWKQDFKGNVIQQIYREDFVISPSDYSNEITSSQCSGKKDFSICYWIPRADTLYNYNDSLNTLEPIFTLKYGNKEIPPHQFIELPQCYIVELLQAEVPTNNGFVRPKVPRIIIDKNTLRGCYFNLKYNMLGNIDGPAWRTHKSGYIIANMYAYEIKEQWEKALKSNLSPEMKQKIRKLNNSITEDDNNIILIGKLK